jgi:hypothetical protein
MSSLDENIITEEISLALRLKMLDIWISVPFGINNELTSLETVSDLKK